MKRIFCLIIFISSLFLRLSGQDFDTRRITSGTGLSNSSVTCILQDSDGQMWFGTWDGLNMYDGKSITVFKPEPGNKESISNNIIREMIEQKPGILWVATDRGINRLDVKTGKAERFFFGSSGWDIPTEHAFIISKDAQDRIFAFIYGQGAFVFNANAHVFERVPIPGTNGAVKAIYGKNNELYILNQDNLIQRIKLSSNENDKFYMSESTELVTNATNMFLDSRDSSIWYSNHNGLISNLESHATVEVPVNVGKTGKIFSLCLHKGIWQIGTEHGLFRYDPDNGLADCILKDIPILSLTDGTQDILWVGTDMQGVYQLSDTKATFTTYPEKGSFKFGNSAVRSFHEDIYSCSNADKVWSDNVFTLGITISTPWYKTIYANIAYILLIAFLMYMAYRFVRFRMETEERIRNEEMEKQKIKEIQEAKLVFFTNIAHEFSNTLTLIYGPCEKLLLDSSISSVARKYLKVIASNSDRMQSMIRQLLDFRKADTGHLKLEITPVDMTDMARSEAENYREIMEEHNIRFSMNFQPSTVIWNVDRSSTEKIIFNLLSNAVKYTPDSEQITINCSVSDDVLVLRVTNTGIGIDKEHQISIFDRYEVVNKVEQAFARGNTRSTGIGLALCKSLAEVMGGTIRIDSDGSTYTTFIVTIPKLEPTIEAGTQVPTAEKKPSQQPVGVQVKVNADVTRKLHSAGHSTALVVDDEQEIREFIKDTLGADFTVMEAENGQEALDKIHDTTPDIIISDVMMPVMDGDKMVRELKSDEGTRHIPVILLSAKSTMESQIEGLENGADAYIAKPFNPRHLMATVNNLLDREKAIIDYSRSANAAMQKFGGNVVKKEDREFILRVTDLIISNMNNGKLNMTFLSEECSISQMQLYRKAKELLQMTPVEYIKTLRMERAEDLLKSTSMSVQEVMYECGFSSKSYFFKEFATKFGCTPGEYRKKR